MEIIEFTSSLAGPFYAFPWSEKPSFANWTARRVLATGSAGAYSASVDTAAYGKKWLVFAGATAPSSWDNWIARIDFDEPRYGDTQRWNNGTDTLDVTITKV